MHNPWENKANQPASSQPTNHPFHATCSNKAQQPSANNIHQTIYAFISIRLLLSFHPSFLPLLKMYPKDFLLLFFGFPSVNEKCIKFLLPLLLVGWFFFFDMVLVFLLELIKFSPKNPLSAANIRVPKNFQPKNIDLMCECGILITIHNVNPLRGTWRVSWITPPDKTLCLWKFDFFKYSLKARHFGHNYIN